MKILIFCALIVCPMLLMAEKKTICLNMIVKDEAPVIRRALASVKGIIDTWVIVDTGSSDGTQEIIREFLKDVPGELVERKWVSFCHNRNEALELAKDRADYILFIDADEELLFSEGFQWPELTADSYLAYVIQTGNKFKRELLIKAHLDWRWVGVMHEYVDCREAKKVCTLEGVYNSAMAMDGNRSKDPAKFLKDAAVLEKALEVEPNNTRYAYFLGQTLSCAGEYERALKAFRHRAAMEGWDQEKFLALFYAAKMEESLKKNKSEIIHSYCLAYQQRPCRAEPLYHLASLFNELNINLLGYWLAREASTMETPGDTVHLEHWIYDYGAKYLTARCALHIGQYIEAGHRLQALLQDGTLPERLKPFAEADLKACLDKL